MFLCLRTQCMYIQTVTRYWRYAPKIKTFFIVQKRDLIQKYKVNLQNSLVLFYHLKTLTQIRLNHTSKRTVGQCKSLYVQMVVLSFLENQIVFSKLILSSAEYSKILVSWNSGHETDWKKVHHQNFGPFLSVSQQIRKAHLSVTCVGSFYFIWTKSLTLQMKWTLHCTTTR